MLTPSERVPALRCLDSMNMGTLTFVAAGQFKGSVQLVGQHCHNGFEVLYHTEGKGLIRFGDHLATVRAYDLAFIPPGVEHAETSDPHFLKALIWIRFQADTSSVCPPFILTDAGGRMRADFEALFADSTRGGDGADQMCRLRTELIVRGIRRLAAAAPEPDDAAVWLQSYLYNHYDEPVHIGELARAMGFSVSHLVTIFTRRFGQSPGRFLTSRRLEAARSLLVSGDESVGWVAARVGFGDPLYFSRIFRKYCGQTPSAYRRSFRESVPPPPCENAPLPECML